MANPMPNPHHISLSKAWTTLASQSGELKLQRMFHKPTNLCPLTSVRLRIENGRILHSVQLNGQELLGNSNPLTENALPDEAENSSEFGYDWEITSALATRNVLVLAWPMPDTIPPESPPKFEAWLEIFAP